MIPSFAILHFEMPRISAERLINLSHHIFFLKTWITLLGYILSRNYLTETNYLLSFAHTFI